MTFGFPRRRPSAKGLGILALVAVVLFLVVGLLGKAGSGGGGSGSGASGPPATGPGPTRGPQGPEQAGEWTFDEGAGRAAADTAGSNPLALLAGASWDPDGAVVFDGTRGYAQTSQAVLDTAGSYSVAAWVRLDRVPDGFATAVSQDGGRDDAFALQYVPSGHWAMSGPDGRALSGDPPVRGQWTQLAGVRDGTSGQLTLYVDGVRQAPPAASSPPAGTDSPSSSSSPGSPAAGSAAGGPLVVGRGRSAGRATAFFPGAVDNVRVYQGALRDEDVQRLYQSGR